MEKGYAGDDKRRFKRIMFSAADEIVGLVQLPNDAEVALKIADIGAGGLRFIPQRHESAGIRTGTTLLLLRIQGQNQLAFLSGLKLVVKWKIDESQFAHVMIGCEFVACAANIRRQIDHFVAVETKGEVQRNF
jgi:c-di-GMP-binding flagellar brake protein YcgR